MEKKELSSPDGTPASPLAFGTMQFGGRADERGSKEMFEACIAKGLNHFDTAHVYTDGASEQLLGKFAQHQRDKLIIATKAGYTGGAGSENLRSSAETSRRRIGVDTIDVLYLHRFDPNTDPRETFEALADLRHKGQIRYVGLSNYAAWQVVKAAGVAATFDLEITLIQPMYSLAKRQAEVEILPMAQDLGIHVAPYSPLGGGLLTGKYLKGQTGRLTEDTRYAARYDQQSMRDAAQGLAALSADLGISPVTLAVAWVAHHAARPMPIISARSAEQLVPSLEALDTHLDAETYARLSALSPTPPPATDRLEEQA